MTDPATTTTAAGGLSVPRGSDAVAVRQAAATARAETQRRVLELREAEAAARADLEEQRRALEADFARRRAELDAQLAPMQAELAKLAEVAWTVDLYLGRDETLRLVRDGEPAPVDEPITIRQKVLSMAEESLVMLGTEMLPHARKNTGLNADDLPEFLTWLTADDANLDRVLPEAKGVVVLVPTWIKSETGNPWEDAGRDAENREAYWLIRNGQRLHVLNTNLSIGRNLLPLRNEFTDVFEHRLFGRRIADLEPGSEDWLRAEKQADAKRRHYMRVMLVLQGLADRTTVWHPLPPAGVNLMHVSAQDQGHVRIVQDGDTSLQLGDGRETFADWQTRLNNLLRPGLRIVGNFTSAGWHQAGRGYSDRWDGRHRRVSPPNASYPPTGEPLLVEGRKDGGLVVKYKRTDEVWRSYEEPVPGRPGYVYRGERLETPKQRASAVLYPGDDWILPFDLATVDDLTHYLNSRENRSDNLLAMVPVIHAALAAKRVEAEQEAPFRVLLAGELIAAGAAVDDAEALVDELVHWWKVANTWSRPLNGEPAHEAKAARQIVAEYRARNHDDSERELMVEAGKRVPGVIAVARNRQGQWHAYAPSQPAHDPGVWLDVTRIGRGGKLGETKRWQKLPQRTATNLQVAWSTEAWATWLHHANPNHYLTGPERDVLVDEALRRAAAAGRGPGRVLAVTEFHDPTDPAERILATYEWNPDTLPADADPVALPDPLSWHHRNLNYTTLRTWKVTKDRDGVRLAQLSRRHERVRADFACYSAAGSRDHDRWGQTPWWPDDATDYGEARPRLVWADESLLDDMKAWQDRCKALHRERQAAKRALSEEAYRYVNTVLPLIRERQEAAVRERFVDDFGPDAMDLWPTHLETLDLQDPIHPRDLWALIAIRLEQDMPVVGCTLASLRDDAHTQKASPPGEWHHNPARPVDLHGYDNITVPDPDLTPDDAAGV